ncbi:hypothetical protein PSACC_02866 [Paramicrosporidium saccamoebae]|uniref:Transcription elongation factor SPT6 n=1 Tax=Paramicrosporidium saccamoebae TaxID=1246581 RepID=A0A2H9THY6_9FUNG|nr:hypothetical protein PSACC_02866 [Paramicrosporidium saccamoebae]
MTMDPLGKEETPAVRGEEEVTVGNAEVPVESNQPSTDELEDEDLELLNENLKRSGFRRLQQRIYEDDSKETFAKSEDSEDDAPIVRKRVAKEDLEKLFDEDEPTYDQQRERELLEESEDEMADFIEEMDEDRPKPKEKTKTKAFLAEAFGGRLPARVIQDILDIFGDGTDYLGLVDDGDEDNQDNQNDEDNENNEDGEERHIRGETGPAMDDIPERLKKREGPEPEELEAEATWIALKWSQDVAFAEKFVNVDHPTLVATIAAVLSLFREHLLEVPTVATHRKEYFQHLMGLNDLWSIWDLDEQWALLRRQQKLMLQQVEDELLVKVVQSADSMEILAVVSDYLRWDKKRGTRQELEQQRIASTLAMEQFVENLQKQQCIHHPNSSEGNPLDSTALIAHVSAYIGHHPYGHLSIRSSLERMAAITVTPTERGLQEVDNQHEMASILYVTNKPTGAFQEDQFLLLVKGEAVGLLTFQVVFPGLEESREHFSRLYGAGGEDEWSQVRRQALSKAIDDFILPPLRRHVTAKLRHNAERWVATAGQYLLQDKMMSLPYTGTKAMAVSWGTGGPDAVLMAVIVDNRGRVLEQTRIARLHPKHRANNRDEWDRLVQFAVDNEPGCILVAGRTLETRDLYEELRGQKISYGEGRTKRPTTSPTVMYAEDDTARIYCISARGQREWPDMPPLVRYCIAVARRWMNPLFELTALSDVELLALDPSPLASLVRTDTRLKHLHRAFVNVVNLVGVDLHQTLSGAWMRSPLQYVCGLGPRKAEMLVKSLAHTTIANRTELSRWLGPVVCFNCASFLRISGDEPLDRTRVHPENYPLARKMAADAMELALEDDERAVHAVMQHPTRLDDLLLDEYAKELIKRGQPAKHLTLLDIKAELQQPYTDLRTLSTGPSEEALFEMLTGENERTLWIGAPVRVQIVRVGDRIIARLASGVEGTLHTGERLRPGQSVDAKVVSIDLVSFSVDCKLQRPDESCSPRFGRDPYYDSSRIASVPVRTPSVRSAPRVVHPAFRNVSRSQAETLLKDAVLGEAIFRPSSRDGAHVTCTWKLDDGPTALFQHIDLQLRDNEVRVGSLHYEDLDEVVARHIEPIASYLRDVKATPKYHIGDTASHLLEMRRQNPDRIAYCLVLDHRRPGHVILSFQPGGREYREPVDVTPSGFILRGKRFDTIEALIVWFKQNYRSQ